MSEGFFYIQIIDLEKTLLTFFMTFLRYCLTNFKYTVSKSLEQLNLHPFSDFHLIYSFQFFPCVINKTYMASEGFYKSNYERKWNLNVHVWCQWMFPKVFVDSLFLIVFTKLPLYLLTVKGWHSIFVKSVFVTFVSWYS